MSDLRRRESKSDREPVGEPVREPVLTTVPRALKVWFVIHFVLDVAFAVPLLVVPESFLHLLGWRSVDPFSARLIAAAFLGIGIESLLGRHASPDAFKALLNLKIIWSMAAVIGMGITLVQASQSWPWGGWGLLAIFGGFNAVWIYWRVQISSAGRQE